MNNNQNILIRPLNNTDNMIINNFFTYEQELKKFLIEDALHDQELKVSRTYLLFNNNLLIGYVTLLADSLRIEGQLKEFF